MEVMRQAPLVLVPSCSRELSGHRFQVVREPYLQALRAVGLCPLVVPGASPAEWERLLHEADGLLLTGSPSNVQSSYYGAALQDATLPLDPVRDDAVLDFIPKALAHGLPLLAICRGLQEVNVALGGSLNQALHERPQTLDHRAPEHATPEQMFADAHAVQVVAGGLLERLLGPGSVSVNSVHGQGVERLAPGLRVEALAPDGVVEALSLPTAPAFNLCVQWHPEWRSERNPTSMAVMQAFAAACRRHQSDHRTIQREAQQLKSR